MGGGVCVGGCACVCVCACVWVCVCACVCLKQHSKMGPSRAQLGPNLAQLGPTWGPYVMLLGECRVAIYSFFKSEVTKTLKA